MIAKLFRKQQDVMLPNKTEKQETCEEKDRFFASISHEIRTPVNGIAGFTQLLKETRLTEEQNELVDTIHSSSMHLLELINTILDFSKISANKLELENVSFNLFRQIEDTVETHALAASQKDVELGLYIDPNIRTMLMGDPTKLSQVLINLVGNAIKFTNSYGSVDIVVNQIADNVKTVTLEFNISDTGIGMTEEQAEKVFEPFSQGDTSISSHFGGTGLGLAISSKLIRLMGGELQVDSKLGVGSTFSFRLTLEKSRTEGVHVYANQYAGLDIGILLPHKDVYRTIDQNLEKYIGYLGAKTKIYYYDDIFKDQIDLPDILFVDQRYTRQEHELLSVLSLNTKIILMTTSEIKKEYPVDTEKVTRIVYKPMNLTKVIRAFKIATSPAEVIEQKEEEYFSFDGLKVLVAEDNPVNQKLMERILQRYDINVTIVDNGKKAVDSIKKEQFGIIFMDYQMPLMDGLTAAKAIANYEDTEDKKHTPIIILSGEEDIENTYHAEGVDIEAFLQKPIDIDNILSVLQKYAYSSNGTKETSAQTNIHYIYPSSRALIIEQNSINQKLIERALVSVGIETICLASTNDVMPLFENQIFDIIFMADEPPLIDANTLLQQMRIYEKEHFLEETPILVLFDDKIDDIYKERFSALGMSDYLYKPLNVDVIKFHIEHFLYEKRAAAYDSNIMLGSSTLPEDKGKSTPEIEIEENESKKDLLDQTEVVSDMPTQIIHSGEEYDEDEKSKETPSNEELHASMKSRFKIKYIDIPLHIDKKSSQDIIDEK